MYMNHYVHFRHFIWTLIMRKQIFNKIFIVNQHTILSCYINRKDVYWGYYRVYLGYIAIFESFVLKLTIQELSAGELIASWFSLTASLKNISVINMESRS